MPPAASEVPPALDSARAVRRVLLIVGIGTIVLLAAARLAAAWLDPERAAGVELGFGWVALAAVGWTAALPFQALRWRALLPAPRPPAGGTSWLVTGANLLNIALPGPTGEVAAAWVLHRRWGVPLATAVYTSLLARVLALVTLGLLALAGWPAVMSGEAAAGWLQVGALAVGAGGAALGVLLVAPALVARAVEVVAGALPERPRAALRSRARWWSENARSLAPTTAGPWLAAAGWSAVASLVQGGATLAAFHGAGVSPAVIPLLYTHLLASLASVAALVLPGGIGALESVYVAVLPEIGGVPVLAAALGVLAVRQAQLGSMLLSLPALLWLAREASRDRPAPP